MYCRRCGQQIDVRDVTCPHCGTQTGAAPKKKPICLRWWFWLISVAITCILLVFGFSFMAVVNNMDNMVHDPMPAPIEDESTDLEPGSIRLGEENALESALSYLDFTFFSYDGLIEQLESDGYTHEQAVYGAEENGY
ncbi:MAG: Ltp family lipoprotein [Oscillospiraceae bacterium]|nr:Ltp family lipoprotein [Oscillospiraceae bacterium]